MHILSLLPYLLCLGSENLTAVLQEDEPVVILSWCADIPPDLAESEWVMNHIFELNNI